MKTKRKVQGRYKGITQTKLGKFVALIRDPKSTNRRIWLGTFSSAIEAAKAYDKAAFKFHGSKADLNFPLSLVGSNETARGEYFKWTDESQVVLCKFLSKRLAKNRRSSPSEWKNYMLEFQKISHHNFKSLSTFRHKYWEMRWSYILWKSLKKSKNGLRWNKRTGRLDCSDDWWDKKIRENPKYMMIRNRQPSKKLEEAWDQLFGNVVITDDDDDDEDDGDDDGDDDDDDDDDGSASERTLHSSQFGSQGTEKDTPFSNKVRQGDILTPNHYDSSKPLLKRNFKPGPSNSSLMKCEMRESKRAGNATQERALKILKTSSVNQAGNSRISAAMSVINRMVDEGLMVSCSKLWCFTVSLCEDDVKRDLFLSLPDDVGRLAWLQYKQDVAN